MTLDTSSIPPKKSNKTSTSNKQLIAVVWDFDWSLINENTDFYPFKQLNSTFNRHSAKKDAKKIGCQQFTNFQNRYA